ncbi:MAG: 5-formyltetrahydrofolate cyclo-ligase, partial [Betaproteobacteria bacterium]|nr:5-formyltetrahydrofolate cyclo-ligase [Betaproteobacteria bacterium]
IDRTAATRIALAYECQVVTAIPLEPHDQPIDCIITENQIIHRP